MRRAAGWYTIVVGFSMVGVWAMLFIAGEVPELETRPLELGFHLVAEIATALALIGGGVGLLLRRWWGLSAHLLAVGMLIYTLINSSGYYAQDGEIAFLVMFGVFGALALVFAGWALRSAKPLSRG